jgi:hypothetical protein
MYNYEQIYVTEAGLTRRAVRRFENRINELFQNGWIMHDMYGCHISIEKKGLKFICSALLARTKKAERENTANLKESNER